MKYGIHKVGSYFMTLLFTKEVLNTTVVVWHKLIKHPDSQHKRKSLGLLTHCIHSSYMCPYYALTAISKKFIRLSLKLN